MKAAVSVSGLVRIGDLIVNTINGQIVRNGKAVVLPDLSLRVLLCLIRHAPGAVNREVLSAEAWRLDHVTEETIAQRIALLRRDLGDDPKQPRYVRTVRGEGYALAVTPSRIDPSLPVRFAAMAGATLIALTALYLVFRPTPDAGQVPVSAGPVTEVQQLLVRAGEQIAVQQPDETDRAIALFENALRSEPGSVDARVGLSFALSTRVTKFDAQPEDTDRAEALARSVLAEDENNASAWHALGYALDSRGRVTESIAAYERAYLIDPGEHAARSSAAYLLLVTGRFHNGLRMEQQSRAAGQASRYSEVQIAFALDLMGFPEAETWFRRARDANPGQVVVVAAEAEAALRRGQGQAALLVLDTLPDEARYTPRISRLAGRAHLLAGERDAARPSFAQAGYRGASDLAAMAALDGDAVAVPALIEDIRTAMRDGDSWPELPVIAAELLAVTGDSEGALDMLVQAADRGYRDTGMLRHSPFLAALRDETAFEAILIRMERETAAERRLVEADPVLASLFSPG